MIFRTDSFASEPEMLGAARRGLDGDVRRLQACLRLDEFFEGTVDDVEDGAVAAKIGGQPAFDAILRLDDFLDHFEIGFDVGAAEGVDRLFRIADDEQFAGCQFDFAPIRHALVGLLGQVEQNLILDRVGVLKLVDQESSGSGA